MYLLTYRQLQWLMGIAGILLVVGALIFADRLQFTQFILIAAGVVLFMLLSLHTSLGKKFVAYSLFALAISLSFSHFLLNFSRDYYLVAIVYITAFLTLFGLLVTNFQEKNLTKL